jgi:magnesium chelatase family protein
LVAAANPCPCGFAGDARRLCTCDGYRSERYRAKLSGPLLDRIDIRLTIPRLTTAELLGQDWGESSAVVRDRVGAARERQRARYAAIGVRCNAHLPGPMIRHHARLDAPAEDLLSKAVESMALTGRGFDRALKVARTVADLAGADVVAGEHLLEALSYRAPGEEDLARAG